MKQASNVQCTPAATVFACVLAAGATFWAGCGSPKPQTPYGARAEAGAETPAPAGDAPAMGEGAGSAQRTYAGEFMGRYPVAERKPGCVGFIDDDPSFEFEVRADEPVGTTIRVTESAGIDSVLFVEGPDASYCADDGGNGLLPALDATLSPGRYVAYVGSYVQNQGATFAAEILATPDPLSVDDCTPENTVDLASGFESFEIQGDLREAVRECSQTFGIDCYGQFGQAEPQCVRVNEPTAVRVRVTSAPFDALMVLQSRDPSKNRFDDDSGANLNSEVSAVLTPGTYAIRVGGYGAEPRGPWFATVSELDVNVSEDGTISPFPAEECVALNAEQTLSFIGNSQPSLACDLLFPGRNCLGMLPAHASHCVTLSEPMSVTFDVNEASFDTVLAVTGPNVFLFNDDRDADYLSRVSSPLPAGTYQILVGGWQGDSGGPFRLEVVAGAGASR